MNNIAIEVNGIFLKLDKAKIRFKRRSTLFADTIVPLFYSFPFNVPDDPQNLKALGFVNNPQSATPFRQELGCRVYLFGQLWFNGVLQVERYISGKFDCNIYLGSDKRLKVLLETPLRKLDFGDFNEFSLFDKIPAYYIAEYYVNNPGNIFYEVVGVGGAYNVEFKSFWAGNVTDTVNNFIADINAQTGVTGLTGVLLSGPVVSGGGWKFKFRIQAINNTIYGPESIENQVFSPFNAEKILLKNLKNTFDSLIANHANALASEDYSDWYNESFGPFNYKMPPIFNDKISGSIKVLLDEIQLNPYDFNDETFIDFGHNHNITEFYNYSLRPWCPTPFLRYVVERVSKTIGIGIHLPESTSSKIEDLLLVANTVTLPKVNIPLIASPSSIDLRETMPDITVNDLLVSIKKIFFLLFSYDYGNNNIVSSDIGEVLNTANALDISNRCEPKPGYEVNIVFGNGFDFSYQFDPSDELPNELINNSQNGVIRGSVNNIADLPTSGNLRGDIYYVRSRDEYYVWLVNYGNPSLSAFVFYSNGAINKTTGAGQNKVISDVSPLLMKRVDIGGGDVALMPAMRQTVRVPDMVNEFQVKARLAFWRGMQQTKDGKKYPLASYHNIDTNGNQIADNTLRIDGEGGLYETSAATLFDFLSNTRPFKFVAKFKPEEVLKFDDAKKLRIESIDYLMSEMDFTIENGVSLDYVKVTLDLYKR